MGRILAVDYGEKRLGIAISDETKTIAIPRPHIEASKRDQIVQVVKDCDVEKILLGFPVNLKGEEGRSAQKVRLFKDWIQKNINLPVELIDERFSTKEVQKEIGKSSRARKLIDSLVAARMLERYLK